MSKTFDINELVETEDGAVGKVVEICTSEEGLKYYIDFLDEVYESYKDNELKATTKTTLTTKEGESQEQIENNILDKLEKFDKREKADSIVSGIKNIRKRYENKCKDGNAFWKFFEEDMEALIYKEIGADKLERDKYVGDLHGMKVYTSGNFFN